MIIKISTVFLLFMFLSACSTLSTNWTPLDCARTASMFKHIAMQDRYMEICVKR